MKRGRRPMELMIVTVLIGMLFVLPAAPVFALGCIPGADCNGKNPQTTGCSADARSLDTVSIPNGKVELRWSDTCKTFWARVTSWIGPTTIRTRIQRSIPIQDYDDVDFGATQAYNDMMLYSPASIVRAGGIVGSGTTYHYTGYFFPPS